MHLWLSDEDSVFLPGKPSQSYCYQRESSVESNVFLSRVISCAKNEPSSKGWWIKDVIWIYVDLCLLCHAGVNSCTDNHVFWRRSGRPSCVRRSTWWLAVNWMAPWKNWICSTTMKLRKSLLKPVMQQKTCNYKELFGSSTQDRHARRILWTSADICVVHDDISWKNWTTL